MANLTVVVPNALVPNLVVMATAKLQAKGIDTSGMTNAQIGQRYMAERTKDDYIEWSRQQAGLTGQASITQAKAATEAAVSAAITTAASDASGITG